MAIRVLFIGSKVIIRHFQAARSDRHFMFDRTDVEKRVFVEGIVKNTLLECLGKKWETLINGPLSLSLDFTNS
jgi:hypothetical protein